MAEAEAENHAEKKAGVGSLEDLKNETVDLVRAYSFFEQ